MSILGKLRANSAHLAPANVPISTWIAGTEKRDVFASMMPRAREPVGASKDLTRILALARRPPVDLERDKATGLYSLRAQALVELMTSRLYRGKRDCACASMGRPCITSLMPAQAWALYEAPIAGGLLGPIGVGHGKTGLDILMAMVMQSVLAVLLIPPGLKNQLIADYAAWAEHFHVPSLVFDNKGKIIPGRPVLHVLPYSRLSRPESSDMLRQLNPDLIISDEGQKLRHPDTATTGRVLRHFAENPGTRLCVWSGTLTASEIQDYAHLAALSLGDSSPLPLEPAVVEEWGVAINPSDWPAPAGALRALTTESETLHQGFQRRLKDTRGVVSTKAGAIDAAINIIERKPPPMPAKLATMLADLRAGWIRPDGEELVDIFEVARNARQLACGFYYRWKFPRGESPDLIDQWFACRKAYHKELREKLKSRAEHLDSPDLCKQAAIRFYKDPPYEGDKPTWESECWPAWAEIQHKVYHETEAVWVDDFLVNDAVEWARKHRGIVWYEFGAFGARVAELSGLPMHGGGPGATDRLRAEKGDRSIIVSIKAHGTGTDGLQRLYHEQLIANPPSSGDAWEQLLGRLHRIGFPGDEVNSQVYRHTIEMSEALDRALIQAKYIEGTMGTLQKLLAATCSFSLARS